MIDHHVVFIFKNYEGVLGVIQQPSSMGRRGLLPTVLNMPDVKNRKNNAIKGFWKQQLNTFARILY